MKLTYTGDFATFFRLVQGMEMEGGGFVWLMDENRGVALQPVLDEKHGIIIPSLETY